MNKNDVLNAIEVMDTVLRQYEADVPVEERREEGYVIQNRLDQFLQNTFTLLPPSPRPIQTKTCPVCQGTGKI